MKSDSLPQPPEEGNKMKKIDYSCRIGNYLQERLSQHILKLESYKRNETKQKWIEEAIREKLYSKEEQNNLAKNNHLHLKIDVELWQDLSAKIEELKAFRISSSKKEFIEEAIFEKLDREEQLPKKLLKKMAKLDLEVKVNPETMD